MKLQDKVVWVTGASSGIGEALVHALAQEGAKVVLSARREPVLQQVRQEAGLTEENSLIIPLDLSSDNDFLQEYRQIRQKFGRVDILINNGGISQRSYFQETSGEVARRVMETNFFGALSLIKVVLPDMVSRQTGMLVAVTSVVGKYGTPLRAMYAASKHAMHGLHESIRAEHWKDRIRVLLVAPGYVNTHISYNAVLGDGTPQGKLDKGQAGGLSPQQCAQKIIRGMKKEKREIYPAGLKELAGVYLKRFVPGLFSRIVRNINVR